MKKLFALASIFIAALFVFQFYTSQSRPPDMSGEMNETFTKQKTLPEDSRYDLAYVVRPYAHINDKDGINLEPIRKQFGDTYTDDGSLLLVFIKNNSIAGFATIPRSIPKIDQLPEKLIPQPAH